MKHVFSTLAILTTLVAVSACKTIGEGVAWDLVPEGNRIVTSASAASASTTFPTNAICRPGVEGFAQAGNECLPYTKVAASLDGCDAITGYMYVHGDGGPVDTPHNKFFEYMSAERTPCAQYFTMTRPGYPLMDGRQGSGDKRFRIGNTQVGSKPEKVYAVAMLLRELQKQHPEIKTWSLIGSSSGSNIAGRILGDHPGLAQGGFLMSGNFDLMKWIRMHPEFTSNNVGNSLSAIDVVGGVPKNSVVFALTGDKDNNTPISLAEDYAKALKAADVQHVRVGSFSDGHDKTLGWIEKPSTQEIAQYLTEYDQLLRQVTALPTRAAQK